MSAMSGDDFDGFRDAEAGFRWAAWSG